MNVAVLYGSVRPARQGIRVARFLVRELESRGHRADLIDPRENPLPLLERRLRDYGEGEVPEPVASLAERLRGADAYVLVSAEYNHTPPPALINLLDHFTGVYTRKPALLVTYSASDFGGIRSTAVLRELCAALGMVTLPGAVAVPRVGSAFEEDGTPADAEAWERRAERAVGELAFYGEALARARADA